MSDQPHPILKTDPNSSVIEKLPADQRRKLDQAVVDREPPTLKAVYEKYRLADHGLSRSAFYRYARRRRCLAAARDLAQLTLPDDDDARIPDMLHKLLAHRLLDALADESTSPRALQRLTDAWRAAVRTRHDLDTHLLRLADVKKREDRRDIDEICDLTRRYAKLVRADNQNRSMRNRDPAG